jgi:hypothetical protein
LEVCEFLVTSKADANAKDYKYARHPHSRILKCENAFRFC